jgi:hypothetical protein
LRLKALIGLVQVAAVAAVAAAVAAFLSNTSAWLAEQGAGFLETVAAGVEPEGILLPQVLVFPLVQPLLLQ